MEMMIILKVLGILGGLALYIRGGVLYMRHLGLSNITAVS
jgi:hypothetical protein